MSDNIPESMHTLWQDLNDAYSKLFALRLEFFQPHVPRIALIRHAMTHGSRNAILQIGPILAEAERMELFPEWVYYAATGDRQVVAARAIIASLPRAWVLDQIEAVAETFLTDGTYWEYHRLLELYRELDPALTQRLANRAIQHSDADIREAGEDFLTHP